MNTTTHFFAYSYTSRVLRTPVCGGMRAPSAAHVQRAFAKLAADGKVTVTPMGGTAKE